MRTYKYLTIHLTFNAVAMDIEFHMPLLVLSTAWKIAVAGKTIRSWEKFKRAQRQSVVECCNWNFVSQALVRKIKSHDDAVHDDTCG